MRHSYKTALRVKGIKPIPPYHRLRSHRTADDQHIICEALKPRRLTMDRWLRAVADHIIENDSLWKGSQ